MTLSQLKTILEGANSDAFKDKVAYRCFPAGSAPALPFICIMETETENFKADGKVYQKRQFVDIELYQSYKAPEIESAIESVLNANEIIWDKSEQYIEDENTIMVTYEVVIDGNENIT